MTSSKTSLLATEKSAILERFQELQWNCEEGNIMYTNDEEEWDYTKLLYSLLDNYPETANYYNDLIEKDLQKYFQEEFPELTEEYENLKQETNSAQAHLQTKELELLKKLLEIKKPLNDITNDLLEFSLDEYNTDKKFVEAKEVIAKYEKIYNEYTMIKNEIHSHLEK